MSEYINIKFQSGPIRQKDTEGKLNGVNGCQIEDVIDVLVSRLEEFQKSDFACTENAQAIRNLGEAKHCLEARTNRRQLAGVEGMDKLAKGDANFK